MKFILYLLLLLIVTITHHNGHQNTSIMNHLKMITYTVRQTNNSRIKHKLLNGQVGMENTKVIFIPSSYGFGNNFRSLGGIAYYCLISGIKLRIFWPNVSNYLSVNMNDFFETNSEDLSKCKLTNNSRSIAHGIYCYQNFIDISYYLHRNKTIKRITYELLGLREREEVISYFSRNFFQLNDELTSISWNILDGVNTSYVIGIQLRTGSGGANFNDTHTFLTQKDFGMVKKTIENVIQTINTTYTLYVSTDSTAWLQDLRLVFPNIITANRFQIGHTTTKSGSFLKRALVDIYTLSKCDILITTRGSTFGDTAHNLNPNIKHYYFNQRNTPWR